VAKVTFNGSPGSTWQNTTGKVQYQLHVKWANSCGLCAQYDRAIGPWWPIPFHRNCRCVQKPVHPNGTSEPFVDFREKIRELDRDQQGRICGVAALKLVEAGTVQWNDVVTSNRIRSLREVVSRQKLTVRQMTDAGVKKSTAEKAHGAVHTPEHEHAEEQRKEAVAELKRLGVGSEEVRKAFGEGIAKRVAIKAGPSERPEPPSGPFLPLPLPPGPAPAPRPTPAAPAAPTAPTAPAAAPTPSEDPAIARAVALAEAEGVRIEPKGYALVKAAVGAEEAASTPAIYGPSLKRIEINERNVYWADSVDFMRRAGAGPDPWFSSDDPDHIIRHELAHALHHRAVGDAYLYGTLRRPLSVNQRAVALKVSRYAAHDRKPVEFVAETYAGLKAGKTYDKQVMRLYRHFRGPSP
jgi:hypothetical protein